jgi:hypothetical protein
MKYARSLYASRLIQDGLADRCGLMWWQWRAACAIKVQS